MEDRVYDEIFTEEISNKMQVPKTIKVNGDVSNFRPTSFNGDDNNRFGDNFDMRVPEKIILLDEPEVGNNQHMGSSSKPREFVIDDYILPQPPPEEIIRVQTPPQKITMSTHRFPSVLDDVYEKKQLFPSEQNLLPSSNNTDVGTKISQQTDSNMSFFNTSVSEPMTLSEEVAHLRQQMGRVSRRVIELEHNVSLPFYVREKKLITILVCSYLFLKFTSWLARR